MHRIGYWLFLLKLKQVIEYKDKMNFMKKTIHRPWSYLVLRDLVLNPRRLFGKNEIEMSFLEYEIFVKDYISHCKENTKKKMIERYCDEEYGNMLAETLKMEIMKEGERLNYFLRETVEDKAIDHFPVPVSDVVVTEQ